MKLSELNPVSTFDEYLEVESFSDVRHEWVDGQRYPLPSVDKNYSLIVVAVNNSIRSQLRYSSYKVYLSDMVVKTNANSIGKERGRYPDVMVSCPPSDSMRWVDKANLIVEVLSPSSEKMGQNFKLLEYMDVIQHGYYLLVHQDKPMVESFQIKDNVITVNKHENSDIVDMPEIELNLKLDDIYAGIDWSEPN